MIALTAKINLAKITGAKVHKKDGRIFLEITNSPLFHGKAGAIYLDAVFHEKANEYGDDGFLAESLSKAAREKGEKGAILGNWKYMPSRDNPLPERPARSTRSAQQTPTDDGEDIPF